MNNTVRNKKTVLALSFAMLVSGISSNVYADTKASYCSAPAITAAATFLGLFTYDTYKNRSDAFTVAKFGRNATAAAALALFVRYYTKESVAEKDYKETSDVKKLADVKNIATKEYWENFLNVIDEKIVGQRPKDSKPKFEETGDKIELVISVKRPGKGLMGKSEELAKPFKEAAVSAAAIIAIIFGNNTVRDYIAKGLGLDKLKTEIDKDKPEPIKEDKK